MLLSESSRHCVFDTEWRLLVFAATLGVQGLQPLHGRTSNEKRETFISLVDRAKIPTNTAFKFANGRDQRPNNSAVNHTRILRTTSASLMIKKIAN